MTPIESLTMTDSDRMLWVATGWTPNDIALYRDSEWLERRGFVSEAEDVRAYLRERRGR